MRRIVSGVGVLWVLLGTAAAAQTVMDCSFPPTRLGWVDGTVAFHLAQGADVATLDSPYVQRFVGKQVEAKVILDDPKLIVLSWSVRMKNDRNQYTTMKYKLRTPPGGGQGRVFRRSDVL